MTGHSEQPAPGSPGFPPDGPQPPADQHDEEGAPQGLAPGGGLYPGYGQGGAERDQLLSLLAYLGMIFFLFLPPLVLYLASRRTSPFVRYHAAQALNLWITAFGYTLSCLILGGLLALDTTATALAVGIPLACLVWAAAAAFAVLGGVSASRGGMRQLPAWICSPMVT